MDNWFDALQVAAIVVTIGFAAGCAVFLFLAGVMLAIRCFD